MEQSARTPDKRYTPRLRSPHYDHQINAHAKRAKVLSDYMDPISGRNTPLLPHDWRLGLMPLVEQILSRCSHTQRAMFEVENDHGIWGVEICVECGTQVAKECPHVQSEWNEAGTALICTNCGIDGT